MQATAFVRKLLSLFVIPVVLIGCTEPAPVEPAPPAFQVDDEQVIRDAAGNALLFRGMNARILGLFDADFDTGRPPNLHIPDFTEDDVRMLASYGFNFLRLPINWSGIEPERGTYESSYIERMREVIDWCAQHGIYVLIDFHQDGFSKWIGEDGAPYWAIQPPPPDDYVSEHPHLSAVIIEAVENFWRSDELMDAYADVVAFVDAEFRHTPNVVGIEIINEPIDLTGRNLFPFYMRVIERVERENPNRIWFFEPNATRNVLDKAPISLEPFPRQNAVYSPHIYTAVFTADPPNFDSGDTEPLKQSMYHAQREAEGWQTPLFIGELGYWHDRPNAQLWFETQIDLQNEVLAHSAFWVWKEFGDTWGLFDHNNQVTDTVWTPREWMQKWITSPYPAEVEGKLTALSFDRTIVSAEATVELQGSGRVLWGAPRAWFPDGALATCDGKPAQEGVVEPGRHEIFCPPGTTQIALTQP